MDETDEADEEEYPASLELQRSLSKRFDSAPGAADSLLDMALWNMGRGGMPLVPGVAAAAPEVAVIEVRLGEDAPLASLEPVPLVLDLGFASSRLWTKWHLGPYGQNPTE